MVSLTPVRRIRVREPYRAWGRRIGELNRRLGTDGVTLHSGRNLIKTATLSIPAGESIEVAIKAFRVPDRLRGFIYARLRPSKAWRSMAYAEKLLELGIGTPDPVACIEYEDAGCLRESYYICRYWPADVDLTELLYKGGTLGAENGLAAEAACPVHTSPARQGCSASRLQPRERPREVDGSELRLRPRGPQSTPIRFPGHG